MATTTGSVEIINRVAQTSDGITVNTPDVSQLPAALATLRGLTGFAAVTPIPTIQQEVGRFVYRDIGQGQFEREFVVEMVQTPVADAMWTAKTPAGAEVEVLFRKTRTLTPDQMDAARALAEIQAQRLLAGE